MIGQRISGNFITESGGHGGEGRRKGAAFRTIKREGHLINTNFIKNLTNIESGVLGGKSGAEGEGGAEGEILLWTGMCFGRLSRRYRFIPNSEVGGA